MVLQLNNTITVANYRLVNLVNLINLFRSQRQREIQSFIGQQHQADQWLQEDYRGGSSQDFH